MPFTNKLLNHELWATVNRWALFTLAAALTFSSALVEISFMVALISWFLCKGMKKSWQWPMDQDVLRPLIFYLGLCLLSAIFSEYPYLSFRGSLKLAQHVMIFLMVCDTFKDLKRLAVLERVFLGIVAVLCLNGFAQYFIGIDLIRGIPYTASSAGPRLTASFKTYGLFAAYLILTVSYIFSLGLKSRTEGSRGYVSTLYFLAGASSLLLLFLTRSRGAILSLFLAVAFFFLLKKRIKIVLILFTLLVACVFVLPRSMIVHLDIRRREQSLVERYHLWGRALQVIQAKPLLGTGINTYTIAHPKYDKRKHWRVQSYYAHNGYLQLAAETGVPSLLAFLWFLGAVFRRGVLRLKEFKNSALRFPMAGLTMGLLSFLIFTGVDTVFHNPQAVIPFWYILGVYFAYPFTPKK